MQFLCRRFNFNASAEIMSSFELMLLDSDTSVAGVLSQMTYKTLCYCSYLSSQIKVKPTTIHSMVY
jgi:hypothetical protein